MQLKINGSLQTLENLQTISDMVRSLGLIPEMLLIEHNGIALLKHEWAITYLSDGDSIEILRVAAGG